MERTDAQLVVPSVIQPVSEIPSALQQGAWPLGSVSPVQSFSDFFQINKVGVVVANLGQSLAQLQPGVWRLRISHWFFFTGTTNKNAVTFLGVSFDGATVAPFELRPSVNFAQPLLSTLDVVIHTLSSANVTASYPATIAGDILDSYVGFLASRIL